MKMLRKGILANGADLVNFKKVIFRFTLRNFTGETETGWRYTTPILRMRTSKPVFPAPGYNLELPNWEVKILFERLGGDLLDHADKFESIEEVFKSDNTESLNSKGVPCRQRKYLLRHIDLMRRGILTFEYLSRRTAVKPCRKLSKPSTKTPAKKAAKSKE